jgi:hypothetical protein
MKEFFNTLDGLWAPDGCATFQYGEEVRPEEPHIDQVPNFLPISSKNETSLTAS